MKVGGLVGSLQMVNVGCGILRSKLVALWLGPVGVGLFGLLTSALEMLSMLAQLGLRPSAVRELGVVSHSGIPRVVRTIRITALTLGIAGALLTLACSPLLARITFGDTSWWWAFAWLSLAVLLNAVNNAEGAVFQGLKRFRKLARCSMAGTLGGCLVSIPMFYFWRLDSVVPSILAYAVCTWLALGFYREKVRQPKACDASRAASEDESTVAIARRLVTFGMYLTVMGFANYAMTYVFMIYLNHTASEATVGYYNAATTLVTRYGDLLLTALSMEYLPRLAAHARSRRRTSLMVSNQMMLITTALVACIPMFIACSPLIIRLLYSSAFLPALPFMVLAAAATLIKGVSWAMATEIMARGDGRMFVVTELSSCIICLALSIAGFHFGGFIGLGVAYLLWQAAYALIIMWVWRGRYHLGMPGRVTPLLTAVLVTVVPVTALAMAGLPYWGLTVAIPATLWGVRRMMLIYRGKR